RGFSRLQAGPGAADTLLGLLQLGVQARRRRGQARRFVIQRRGQFDTAGHPSVGADGRVRPHLVTDQLHRPAYLAREKTFYSHGLTSPCNQFCPTVATMVTCLLSGISWYDSTWAPGAA